MIKSDSYNWNCGSTQNPPSRKEGTNRRRVGQRCSPIPWHCASKFKIISVEIL